MVALGLIGVALMLVLSLIPLGVHSRQRASDQQSASAWARSLLEETPAPEGFPLPAELALSRHQKSIGPTRFWAERRVTVSGPYRVRIEVTARWSASAPPLVLSLTRYNPAGPPG